MGPVAAAPAGEWTPARHGFDWSFPRDHFSHAGYRTEWWYLTGQLETLAEPVQRFGYQFTIFRVGLVPGNGDSLSISPPVPAVLPPSSGSANTSIAAAVDDDGKVEPPTATGLSSGHTARSAWAATDLLMGHAALGDLDRGEHRFSEVLWRAVPLLGEFAAYDDAAESGRIAWSRGPLGTEETWTLEWNGAGFDLRAGDTRQGFAFELTTSPVKALVFQGPGGYSAKADEPGRASLYTSFTRLDTRGRLTLDGRSVEVRGTSWMDHEFGSDPLAERQAGWDWFGLQLDDGRELMLYLLRDSTGAVDYSSGTLVAIDGSVRYLAPGDFSLDAVGRFHSPASGAAYPSGWRVGLPGEGLELRIEPAFPVQENVSLRTALAYWEGAVIVRDVSGNEVGRGYVELTGYGNGNRPGL